MGNDDYINRQVLHLIEKAGGGRALVRVKDIEEVFCKIADLEEEIRQLRNEIDLEKIRNNKRLAKIAEPFTMSAEVPDTELMGQMLDNPTTRVALIGDQLVVYDIRGGAGRTLNGTNVPNPHVSRNQENTQHTGELFNERLI